MRMVNPNYNLVTLAKWVASQNYNLMRNGNPTILMGAVWILGGGN